jgi:hypothetical protein
MRLAACWDIAWAAFTAWLGGRQRHEAGDCGVLEPKPEVMDVGAGDFEHKGAVTSDELVSVGLGVALRIVRGGVQEELIGPVDAHVV